MFIRILKFLKTFLKKIQGSIISFKNLFLKLLLAIKRLVSALKNFFLILLLSFKSLLKKTREKIKYFKNLYIEYFYRFQELLLTRKHIVSAPKYCFPILLFVKLFHIIAISTQYDKIIGNVLYVFLVAIWLVQFIATYKKGSGRKLVVGVALAIVTTILLLIILSVSPKDANTMNSMTFWAFTIVFVYARIELPLIGFEASTAKIILHSFELLLACFLFMPLHNTYLYHFLTVGGTFTIPDSGMVMSIAASLAFDGLYDAIEKSYSKVNK